MYDEWASKNYYEMFGLERDASKKEIKEAYKEVALVYHPDSNFFSEIIDDDLNNDQAKIFQLLTAAYSTLIDDEKRQKYNETMIIDVETWETDEDYDYEEDDEDFIESDSFSYTQVAAEHKAKCYGVFGNVQADDSGYEPMVIKSAYEIMTQRNNLFQQFLRLMGI